MVTQAVTPTVTLSTTPMVDSAVEVPLPPARGRMPCLRRRAARTFQPMGVTTVRDFRAIAAVADYHRGLVSAWSVYLGCASCFLSTPAMI